MRTSFLCPNCTMSQFIWTEQEISKKVCPRCGFIADKYKDHLEKPEKEFLQRNKGKKDE